MLQLGSDFLDFNLPTAPEKSGRSRVFSISLSCKLLNIPVPTNISFYKLFEGIPVPTNFSSTNLLFEGIVIVFFFGRQRNFLT